MEKSKDQQEMHWRSARRGVALLLLLTMLVSLAPTARAASVFDYQNAGFSLAANASLIQDSATKKYIQTNGTISLTAGSKTYSVGAATWIQLKAMSYFAGDGAASGSFYALVYYDNVECRAFMDDIYYCVQSDANLLSYIKGTLWTAQNFVSLNDDTALRGDVRVHGLQYALQLVGNYSGAMDGNFGSGTKSAVKAFQSANNLTVDGRAGPLTQKALYAKAISAYNNGTVGNVVSSSSVSSSGTGTTSGATSSTGTLITLDKVNLRKSASTSGVRLAVVPKSTKLTYADTATSGGVTWYKVVYGGRTGWLMGTYVNVSGSSSSSSSSTGSSIGTLTITKPNTRVRKTANGVKTGVVLSTGSQVSYYSQTSAAGYTWYYILTPSGIYGYVRGDCATVSSSGGGGSGGTGTVLPSSTKTYISLSNAVAVFLTEEKPVATGAFTTIPAGTVIQMVSPTTYTTNNVEYCSVYYNNLKYNAVYADVNSSIMTAEQLTTYITGTLWKAGYTISLKEALGLKGDIRVHSAQLALTVLGYYTDALDGSFGGATTSAVRNFQRQNKLTVDGSIGPQTCVKLFPMAINAYNTGGSSGSGSSGGGVTVASFGNVTSVEKSNWSDVNNNAWFPKSSTATVLDVKTGQVFSIYRWSGGSHADCVPYSTADTKTMCDIVGFSYNGSHPSTSKFNQIVADSANNNTAHAWPDFPGSNVGSAWDRRPALLNVNGRVFCVSIYGWPHGLGDSSFRTATRNGTKFYELNNYYGMMCVHFVGSTTHTASTPNAEHQAAIQEAYNYAKERWPSLCK